MKFKNWGVYVLVLSLFITLNLFVLSKPSLRVIFDNIFLSFSQVSGLLGTVLLSFVYLLSAKLKFVDNLFGNIGKARKMHMDIGVIAFVLLIQHPIFLILKYFDIPSKYLLYLLPSENFSYNLGIIGFYFLFLLILISLFFNLPYKLKSLIHSLLSVGVLPAFIHVFLVPSDVSSYFPLRIWMMFVILIGVSSILYSKLLSKLFVKKELKIEKLDFASSSNYVSNMTLNSSNLVTNNQYKKVRSMVL